MTSSISLTTSRDRDLGLVLLFISAVTYFVLPLIAVEFGLLKGTAAMVTVPLGLVFMVAGCVVTFLSRKVVTVTDSLVRVKDGFIAKPLNLRFEQTPTFKLSGFEDEKGHRSNEIWTVHMIDQGRQYLIDRRVGQQIVSRSLAERLAKAVRGTLVESYGGNQYKFQAEELDFSFVERVGRYPEMLGKPIPEPDEKVVKFEQTDVGLKVSWSFFNSTLMFELFCVCAFLVAGAFVPLPGGPSGEGFTLFQAEMAEGDYRYFIGIGLFALLSTILLAGYRNTFELIVPKRVQSRASVWGVPIRGGKIALSELEHVAVAITGRGAALQLISDKKILVELMPAAQVARWLAWEIRNRLAELTPQSCQVEQSVEMDSV